MRKSLRNIIVLGPLVLGYFPAANANFECRVAGNGRSQVSILRQSEHVVLYPKAIPTVYSCGPYVAYPEEHISPNAVFVEIAGNECAISDNYAVQSIIFCMPE